MPLALQSFKIRSVFRRFSSAIFSSFRIAASRSSSYEKFENVIVLDGDAFSSCKLIATKPNLTIID